MSRTYDAELSVLLERASAAGMKDDERSGWRRRLDPIALDECGCEASAKATAVVGLLGGAAVLASGGGKGRRSNTLAVAVLTSVTAVAAKLLGQQAALRRRDLLLNTLTGRVRELEALKSSLAR